MRAGIALFILAIAGSLAGCGGAPAKDPAPAGVEKSYEKGPLRLSLRASAAEITTSDVLDLTLSATIDDGHSVAFPDYPQPAAEATENPDAADTAFSPASVEDAPPVLGRDGRVTRSRSYRLEPFLDGNYTIPPLTVEFWKEVEGEDRKDTVETEAVTVVVKSVMDPAAPPEIAPIADPVDLREPFPWLRWLIGGAVLISLAALACWYGFMRQPPPPPPAPPVPPHVRALDALDAIERAKLVEQGRYQEYYVRVSDVLRHYMEDQFQLRAPERTTEEFLAELQHNAVLGLQEQLLLQAFLRHCDLVKFARAEPSSEEIRETFATCRQFILDSEAAHRRARAAADNGEA